MFFPMNIKRIGIINIFYCSSHNSLSYHCAGFTLNTNPPPNNPAPTLALAVNPSSGKTPIIASAPTESRSPETPNSICHPNNSNSAVALPDSTAAFAFAKEFRCNFPLAFARVLKVDDSYFIIGDEDAYKFIWEARKIALRFERKKKNEAL